MRPSARVCARSVARRPAHNGPYLLGTSASAKSSRLTNLETTLWIFPVDDVHLRRYSARTADHRRRRPTYPRLSYHGSLHTYIHTQHHVQTYWNGAIVTRRLLRMNARIGLQRSSGRSEKRIMLILLKVRRSYVHGIHVLTVIPDIVIPARTTWHLPSKRLP